MYCDIIILTGICSFSGKRFHFGYNGCFRFLAKLDVYVTLFSDNLVEEAIGGASAAKSFKESDETGFYDSEVINCLRLT